MLQEKDTNIDKEIALARSTLLSVGFTFNFFWLLNILKALFPGVKNLLNLYDPIGPLLGLYLVSTVVFVVSLQFFRRVGLKDFKVSYFFYVASALLFVLMVFPPIFESIAQAF